MENRPSFDEYFLMMAFVARTRSEDPNTKHGAVITKNDIQKSTGYNGLMSKADKSRIPMHDRDLRRPYFAHAEDNAILFCEENPLLNAGKWVIYITGLPCVDCLQRIIRFGIKEIVHAERMGSITEGQTQEMREIILGMSDIEVRTIPLDNPWVQKAYELGELGVPYLPAPNEKGNHDC